MKKSKITFALIYWVLGAVLMWLLFTTFNIPDYLIWIIGAVMGMFYWSTLKSNWIDSRKQEPPKDGKHFLAAIWTPGKPKIEMAVYHISAGEFKDPYFCAQFPPYWIVYWKPLPKRPKSYIPKSVEERMKPENRKRRYEYWLGKLSSKESVK